MPTRFPTAKVLALGTGASVAALVEGLLGTGSLSAVTGVGGGLLHYLFTDVIGRHLNENSPSPNSLIQNHDLRKLVGEAIADTLRLSAGEGPGKAEAADTIEQLAQGAADLWKNLATATDTDYAGFDEQSVANLFARDVTNFKEVKSLDPATWRGFLDSLNDATHAGAEGALLDSLAHRLHESLAEMFRAKVQQDFTGKTSAQGRGFASLNLMLMGRLAAGVDQLLKQSSGGAISADLLGEIKKLNQRLPSAADQQFSRVDDPEERAALASTLEEIKQWGPRVEGRLNELAKVMAVADVASRRGHARTHGWLKWVVGSLAAVGLLGFVGWSMIHSSQEAHAKLQEAHTQQMAALTAILREKMGPKVVGEDPTKRELPPEVLAAARELLERGNREQQALGKIALGDHTGADAIIQELKRDPLIEAFRVLTLEGDNWYNAGEFDQAIEPYEQALALNPDDVKTLNSVAIAHGQARLGSISAHQLRAIELLEKAASKTLQDDPVTWALTQNNLGVVYQQLPTGDRGENLTQAIRAFGLALEVTTRKAHPVDWAMTQYNLAISLARMASVDSENGCGWLEKALASCKAALTVRTAEAFPRQHAETFENLLNYRKVYEAAGCAEQRPFDEIAPAE